MQNLVLLRWKICWPITDDLYTISIKPTYLFFHKIDDPAPLNISLPITQATGQHDICSSANKRYLFSASVSFSGSAKSLGYVWNKQMNGIFPHVLLCMGGFVFRHGSQLRTKGDMSGRRRRSSINLSFHGVSCVDQILQCFMVCESHEFLAQDIIPKLLKREQYCLFFTFVRVIVLLSVIQPTACRMDGFFPSVSIFLW